MSKQAMIRKVRASHDKGHDVPKIWEIVETDDLQSAVRQWERASGMVAKSYGFSTDPDTIFVRWVWPTETRPKTS